MNSLETHVLRLIGENVSSPDVFVDTDAGIVQIRGSINDAIQELCMVTGSYKKTYFLPLLEGRQFYRLAGVLDYVGYITLVWDRANKRKLTQTDPLKLAQDDPWWLKRTGPPLQYMWIGENVLGVYMMPSAKGTILEMECVCLPKPYTAATDPIKVRTLFQRAAVYFAVSEFYASRGDATRGMEYGLKYLETAGLMQLNPRQTERQWQYRPQGQTEERTNAG